MISIVSKNKIIVRIALATVAILLIPVVAMRFTDEVQWGLFDFVFMGTLLFGTGLLYELVSRKGNSVAYRVAVAIATLTALVLVWMNAAVGIIGDGDLDNAGNLMYFGVLIMGLIGAAIVRFEPRGMVRILFTMAFAQFLVPVIALIIGHPDVTTWGSPGILGVFFLNTCFAFLWVVSALCFRRAAHIPKGV